MLRVLVVGSGGREHTLVWKIEGSPLVRKVFCAPGNAGISEEAECIPIGATDTERLVDFARKEQVDLTVAGPEAPLVAGVVDAFESKGLRIFGPSKAAARIEGSKAWCHRFMERHGIPCAGSQTVTGLKAAQAASERMGLPLVVKASGLAAGKGALVCNTPEDLQKAFRRMFVDREFGNASDKVVLEEFMEGEEASCLALVDGQTFLPLPGSQDHKPVRDGDEGPNTGGMGAYAPAPVLNGEMQERVNREILAPAVKGMAEEGTPYKGVLYAGLMITKEGPRLVEFNCRFGDPESQAVLPLLQTDLAELALAVTEGTLSQKSISFFPGACVCVVLASGGYPGPYEKGYPVSGLQDMPSDILVFHAGTKKSENGIVTAAGRVLGVTASGKSVKEAIQRVYEAVPRINFKDAYYRRDIGAKALRRSESYGKQK